MYTIEARNVNHAYHEALWKMRIWGSREKSRNGEVIAAPAPVATTYRHPTERILIDAKRDANPYFHVMEAMWMLAGNNDVAFPARFAQNMRNYSDNGVTLNGAYGYRWRRYFATDQLRWVIEHLRNDPHSRRAHIAMWDPNDDPQSINNSTKDVPCNTGIDFRVLNGYLNMTVYCRSNDIIWGCYGANAVHMSYLHEFVALSLGLLVGSYTQVSNNWHIYEQHYPLIQSPGTELFDPYKDLGHTPFALMHKGEEPELFLDAVVDFVADLGDTQLRNPYGYRYIDGVLCPMALSWQAHKGGDYAMAAEHAGEVQDDVIKMACRSWLDRRQKVQS
jgi:thymidylate synthase